MKVSGKSVCCKHSSQLTNQLLFNFAQKDPRSNIKMSGTGSLSHIAMQRMHWWTYFQGFSLTEVHTPKEARLYFCLIVVATSKLKKVYGGINKPQDTSTVFISNGTAEWDYTVDHIRN